MGSEYDAIIVNQVKYIMALAKVFSSTDDIGQKTEIRVLLEVYLENIATANKYIDFVNGCGDSNGYLINRLENKVSEIELLEKLDTNKDSNEYRSNVKCFFLNSISRINRFKEESKKK